MYLFFVKATNDRSLQVIFFLLIVSLVNDVYGLFTIARHSENFITYNLLTAVQALLIFYFFYLRIEYHLIKRVLQLLTLVYLATWFSYFVRFGTKGYFNDVENFENVIVLVISIYYFYEKIIKSTSAVVYTKPHFWIVSAFFIYSSGIFFLFLYIPSLSDVDQLKFYSLNYLFTIFKTSLLCVAMCMKQHPVESDRKFKLT